MIIIIAHTENTVTWPGWAGSRWSRNLIRLPKITFAERWLLKKWTFQACAMKKKNGVLRDRIRPCFRAFNQSHHCRQTAMRSPAHFLIPAIWKRAAPTTEAVLFRALANWHHEPRWMFAKFHFFLILFYCWRQTVFFTMLVKSISSTWAQTCHSWSHYSRKQPSSAPRSQYKQPNE